MIAVVIPCYKVTGTIVDVIERIPSRIAKIYVVDDACPNGSGRLVAANNHDPRVEVLFHETNRGVGGAVKTGYLHAMDDGMQIAVKLDGDGQMDPKEIDRLIIPILDSEADFTKANRFFDQQVLALMPLHRTTGNIALSFMSKISTGYWTIFNPTYGYSAIDARLLPYIDLSKLADGFFFESDLLFRLALLRAKVVNIPIAARYGVEISNLQASRVVPQFLVGHARNFLKRIVYMYFIRDFSIASLELLLATFLLCFGFAFGIYHCFAGAFHGELASAGTVMFASLPIIFRMQLLLAFFAYDIAAVPREAIAARPPFHIGVPKDTDATQS